MVIRLCLFVVFLTISYATSAASFDCDKAQTKIEKMVCANAKLSDFDGLLDTTYKELREDPDIKPDEDRRLVSQQKTWLKNVRNRCVDEACLLKVYQDRIDELDPLADKNLTCEKMRRYPDQIFSSPIDLGSGSMSPTNVDYYCPESIASLPFMGNLLSMAETIRSEGGPQPCTGTIIHALWRGYYFSLSEAGFAPEVLMTQRDDDENKLVSEYFKQWAQQSTYNNQLYEEFNTEFNQDLIKLSDYYHLKFKFSAAKSRDIATQALNIVTSRAAGEFSHNEFKPSLQIVLTVSDTNSTLSQLKMLLVNHPPKGDIYLALEAALLKNRPLEYIKVLTESFSAQDYTELGVGHEPLLSFALQNNENLKFLISKKIPIDTTNDFGKTALFYAVGMNNTDAANLLLVNHADVNHAYVTAQDLRSTSTGIDECVYPNLVHTKRTPLMHAAQNSNVEMMKLLLKYGARLNDVDDLGFNALDYAALAHNKDNENYLKSLNLDYGAPVYDPSLTTESFKPSFNLPILGYVKKLAISERRPDILIASVTPWDSVIADHSQGIFLLSLADPSHPSIISHFPTINAEDFAVSADGNRVYVISMAMPGAPAENKFGLFIIDISNPKDPHLIQRVDGDFMTMHLSSDDQFLFVQERNLPSSLSRGTMVFSVSNSAPKLMCTNPFLSSTETPIFAYSFVDLKDDHLLAIHDSSGKISEFDIKNPCSPVYRFELPADQLGIPMIAYKKDTIFVGGNGLSSIKLNNPIKKIRSYSFSGVVGSLNMNEQLNTITAIFGKDVAFFKTKPDGSFVLDSKYSVETDSVGDALISDRGWVYIGTHGKLLVGKLSN